MGYPIKLNTKSGQELFDEINAEFLKVRGTDKSYLFHLGCETDYKYALEEINKFLFDEDSIKKYTLTEDDIEGFAIYNKLHDECSCLAYFRNTNI